jgi:hypothetical protein
MTVSDFFAAVTPLAMGLMTLYLAYLTKKTDAVVKMISENDRKTDSVQVATKVVGEKVQEVHAVINSRLDQLLSAVKASAHAEGVQEGRTQIAGEKAAHAEGKLEGQEKKPED